MAVKLRLALALATLCALPVGSATNDICVNQDPLPLVAMDTGTCAQAGFGTEDVKDLVGDAPVGPGLAPGDALKAVLDLAKDLGPDDCNSAASCAGLVHGALA